MKNKKNGMPETTGAKPMKRKADMKLLGRVFRMLVQAYPVLVPITGVCIVLSAIVSSIPSIFMQKVFDKIADSIAIIKKAAEASGLSLREFAQGNGAFLSERWAAAKAEILPIVGVLIVLYVFAIIFITLQTQLMAKITQGFLDKLRREMFNGMQNLPIKYFDTHKHGDIMSYYTNDIDTLRELVSRSFPQMLQSGIIVLTVFCIMMWYSIPMTLVVMLGVVAMVFVSKKVGGGSAKYFIRNQKSVAKCEGYIQEMMNGQKVIKVFCHEGKAEQDFDTINAELREYNPELAERPQIVAANKCDLLGGDRENIDRLRARAEELGYEFFEMSAVTHEGTRELIKECAHRLAELPPIASYEADYVPPEPVIDTSEELEIRQFDDMWIVEGPWLQRLVATINFGDY